MNRQNQQSSRTADDEITYFDFISTGVGYLNRVREVKPKGGGRKSEPYLACRINVIVGPSNDVEYREFDLRVVGRQAFEAMDIIDQHRQGDNDRIVVTFRAGDARPEDYTVSRTDSRGNAEPQRRFCLKGRLLQIMSAKINGVPIPLPQVDRPVEAGLNPSADDEDRGYGSAAYEEAEEASPRNVNAQPRRAA